MYKEAGALKSWQGLHRFCFRFIFVPFSGVLFWAGQDNKAQIIQHYPESRMMNLLYGGVQCRMPWGSQILFMPRGTVQWEAPTLHLGQQKRLPEGLCQHWGAPKPGAEQVWPLLPPTPLCDAPVFLFLSLMVSFSFSLSLAWIYP